MQILLILIIVRSGLELVDPQRRKNDARAVISAWHTLELPIESRRCTALAFYLVNRSIDGPKAPGIIEAAAMRPAIAATTGDAY